MKIVMRDDRVFQGTPRQIVQQMQDIAMGAKDGLTLSEYIDWVAANALEFEGVELMISGATDDQKAASLLEEMLRVGLCEVA